MNIYLAIMTTILVLTQVIRITQNAISLFRQERELKKQIGWIKDVEMKKEDFETQRDVIDMLQRRLQQDEIDDTADTWRSVVAMLYDILNETGLLEACIENVYRLRDRLRGEEDDL